MPRRVLNERYRLDEIIGSGATATIWRAWDRQLDRAVAVKVLDGPGLGGDTDGQARYRDEARTLARLSHPNIVAVFDSGTDNGFAYVVMELVEGCSALARLANGVMSVAEAASVMAQVCDALVAAHAAGVVHRDIKPGNILLGQGRTVKVCDFGIARLLDTTALTAPHVAVGTSSYMSPEQVAGQSLNGRSDLYSVGCVLFRMLTGTAPFVGDSAFNVAYQQLHNQPPTLRSRRPDIPQGLDALISRLLAKNPAARPATAAEVRAELMRWSDPVTAVPQAKTRYRRPFASVGFAAVAAIAVPAAFLLAGPEEKLAQPPAAAAPPAVSAPAAASASPSASASPRVSPTKARSSPTSAPLQQPQASSSPPPRSATEQVGDTRALVRQLEAEGQLPPPNADDLDHNLSDLNNQIAHQKQREATDKLATIQKKNDDLLAAGKMSTTGHAALEAKLDQLAVAIAAMPTPSP
jgi:eukaryotic-like serine/threonine-protein kinase